MDSSPPTNDSDPPPTNDSGPPPTNDSDPPPTNDSDPPTTSDSDPCFVMLDESDDEETIALEESLEPEMDSQEELHILANVMLQQELLKCRKVDVIEDPQPLVELCIKTLKDSRESEPGPSTNDSRFSELTKFYLINALSSHEDELADVDYRPMMKLTFPREVRTGPLYQAEVADAPAEATSAEADVETGDELIWKPPSKLQEVDIDDYLCRIHQILQPVDEGEPVCPQCLRSHHSDNEKALEILFQCDFNVDVALEKFKNTMDELVNKENANETNKEAPSPPKKPKL